METTADPGHRFNQQQCSSCDGSLARCWCLDCDEALCDACVSAHRRVTLTRSHRILNQPPAGDVSTPPTKFCRLHPSEPLKLFCFTCNQLTCRDCQLMAHMNHRYQFVSEALSSLKKQVEVRVQPIRALGETARQSLLDMEIRLQEVAQCESHLKAELQQSYSILVQHLKKRMEDILSKVKKVCESECAVIQGRMMKLKQLMQNQQSVTETAEKAKNANDLSTLLTYTAQMFPMKSSGRGTTNCRFSSGFTPRPPSEVSPAGTRWWKSESPQAAMFLVVLGCPLACRCKCLFRQTLLQESFPQSAGKHGAR